MIDEQLLALLQECEEVLVDYEAELHEGPGSLRRRIQQVIEKEKGE